MPVKRTKQIQNITNITNDQNIKDPYDLSNPINQSVIIDQLDPYADADTDKDPVSNNKFVPCPELEAKLSKCTINDIPEFSLCGLRTIGKIVDVYDGDTCKIILSTNSGFVRFNCRLKFIDTPEMKPLKNKPNRDTEVENAIKCRNKLIQLTTNCKIDCDDKLTKIQIKKLLNSNDKVIQVQCHEFDKYGRLLVELYLNDKTANNILVEEGFAKLYDGGTKDIFVY